jgi:hypothetical protein
VSTRELQIRAPRQWQLTIGHERRNQAAKGADEQKRRQGRESSASAAWESHLPGNPPGFAELQNREILQLRPRPNGSEKRRKTLIEAARIINQGCTGWTCADVALEAHVLIRREAAGKKRCGILLRPCDRTWKTDRT